ncbi:hypothetical protein TrLO_g7681 [Triparma laevis f. longispina]|uniref:Transmembrane protein n=1 Tax=Triparma laevis f. longispina TaxID=1714387 RepID=A0A9W6ZSY5_9STRA|nr:hypothetical protein TrLO_g7681 [Triparma laevis f. longispina]
MSTGYYGNPRTFTCLNYTDAAKDFEVRAFLPCPMPYLPVADGFEWSLTDTMILLEEYTCDTTTYADEGDELRGTVRSPLFMMSRIVYGLPFFIFFALNMKWIIDGAKARVKSFSLKEMNQMECMMFFLALGAFMRVVKLTTCYCVMAGWAVDGVLILAITGWTGMNDIQGTKAVIPTHYIVLRNVFLFGDLFLQVGAALMEPYMSTIGDERIMSALNINVSYYDGTLSSLRHLANLLTEFAYTVVLVIEGIKLRKTLKGGKAEENPAARKVLKYIKTCLVVMPMVVLFRTSVIIGRVGVTSIGSRPSCSTMGSLISGVDPMFGIV